MEALRVDLGAAEAVRAPAGVRMALVYDAMTHLPRGAPSSVGGQLRGSGLGRVAFEVLRSSLEGGALGLVVCVVAEEFCDFGALFFDGF